MKMKILALLLFVAAAPAFASHKQVTVTVKGMVCGFCAQGITKKLQAEPGVEKVTVSLETKLVKVSLKDGSDISNETLERILKEAGYNTDKIERN